MSNLRPMCVVITFPSTMDVSEDRACWYVAHAIRGYWQQFASETDPIRGMSRCDVAVKPLASFVAECALAKLEAEIERLNRTAPAQPVEEIN